MSRPAIANTSAVVVPPWLQFHFLVRVALLIQALTAVALAWWVPNSLTAKLIEAGDASAKLVLCAMSLMVLVGLADALINDVLPSRFRLLCAQHHRHIGFMLLGAIYLMQAFAGLDDMPVGAGILIANYVATGATCGAFAIAETLRPDHAP